MNMSKMQPSNVVDLFEEQVVMQPDKTAVITCDVTLSYSELNQQANKIAHSLIVRDISSGDIVAFALPRKSYLIAILLIVATLSLYP